MARFNSNGSADTSFDTDGRVTTTLGTNPAIAQDVAIQTDGKIVVAGTSDAGFTVVRYNANGSLDTTFDTDGIVTTNLSSSGVGGQNYDVVLQTDGDIVTAGRAPDPVFPFVVNAIARYLTDGSLDTTFDTNGSTLTRVPPAAPVVSIAHSLAIQVDGKIVVAGSLGSGTGMDIVLVRYNTDGTIEVPNGKMKFEILDISR